MNEIPSFYEDVLVPDPFTDDEITALMMQEPLPPNQGFQLSSEEQNERHNEQIESDR